MKIVRTTLAGLSCRVVEQEGGKPPQLVVILCHGYGAPGDDLVGLAPALLARGFEQPVRFIFPEALLSLPEAGYPGARAWWPLDMMRLLAERGTPEGRARMASAEPEGLPKARRALISLVETITQQTKLPIGRILLGGFSQGAMLATDVTLRLEEAPAALAIFSGTLLNQAEWKKRAPARKGLKVLQSHGTQDGILAFEGAKALEAVLREAGLDVEFIGFDGDHTIPPAALAALHRLIAHALAKAKPPTAAQ